MNMQILFSSTLTLVLFGILQGLTEFLPISSSGHLTLFQYFSKDIEENLSLNVAVHVGTFFTIIVYYRRDIIKILTGFIQGDPVSYRMAFLILTASVPTALIGLSLKKNMGWMLTHPLIAALCLLITGGILFASEKIQIKKSQNQGFEIGFKQAFLLGFVQGVAVLPGISRSGSTIVTGLFLGMSPANASRFSFFIALPAILGATFLEFFVEKNSVNLTQLCLGTLVSFITGLFAISWMVNLTKRAQFKPFAVYVVFISISFLILYSGGWGRGSK